MGFIIRYDSPLGAITLASDGFALTGLWFEGQKYFSATLTAEHTERIIPVFEKSIEWLDIYFSGRDPGFSPPLCLKGTDFQNKVWNILLKIPYGKTVTYGQIAEIMVKTGWMVKVSARAVGGAVGRNPVSIIVPCHRVIGADGSLTGYAGGVERKKKLLALEMKSCGIL